MVKMQQGPSTKAKPVTCHFLEFLDKYTKNMLINFLLVFVHKINCDLNAKNMLSNCDYREIL